MRAVAGIALGLLALGGCGGGGDPTGDGGPGDPDADMPGGDGGTGETYVTGTFEDGTPFELRYAIMRWGTTDVLCVAEIPITNLCSADVSEPFFMLAAEVQPGETGPEFYLPGTVMMHAGAGDVEPPTAGSIDAQVNDRTNCRFEATIELTFSNGLTSGTVVTP